MIFPGTSINPTRLKVGAEGNLFGQHATVEGWSVLRSDDGYRWDEFHLRLGDGTRTTLVYESGLWKRFDLFDPRQPMTADQASALGVGDSVTIENHSAQVTYVGQSRVASIEGSAPEGYHEGSRAQYFNAQALDRLFVVSWTGEEVEYYRGLGIERGEVERAFGLPEPGLFSRVFAGGSGGMENWLDSLPRLLWVIAVVGGIALVAAQNGGSQQPTTAVPPARIQASSARLPLQPDVLLAGHRYAVVGHVLNEIGQMGGRFERHEYDLVDVQGEHSLLVEGLTLQARQWILFGPRFDRRPIAAEKAAALRQGSLVAVDGQSAVVRTLFLCRTLGVDGQAPAGVRVGGETFGLAAQNASSWYLLRWDGSDMEARWGQPLAESDIRAAFGSARAGK